MVKIKFYAIAFLALLAFPPALFADTPVSSVAQPPVAAVTASPEAAMPADTVKPADAAAPVGAVKPVEAAVSPDKARPVDAAAAKPSDFPVKQPDAATGPVVLPKDGAPANFIQSSDAEEISGEDDPAEADDDDTAAQTQPSELDKDIVKPVNGAEPEYKNAVDKNVHMFSGGLKEHFSRYLQRSGKYLAMMKDIFRENYMPEDLVFLALIESGFNPKAYSWARASGPWQFIRGTAKKYGLRMDGWVDERRDPVKSTKAAAAYLKDLHEMFGTWSLAMASYNAGEGNVARAVNRNGTLDFWALRKTRSLPSETKEYVPKFMAAKMIAQDPGAFGFENIEYETPFVFDEVVLNKSASLLAVAKCCGVSVSDIKDLNPELIRWCTPPNSDSYTLRIPKGTKETFDTNFAQLADDPGWQSYVVRRGDTIRSIGHKFGVPVSIVKQTNTIKKLRVGQALVIPTPEYAASIATEKHSDESKCTRQRSYKARKGDTLASVAAGHGMSAKKLARLNGLSTRSKLRAGQRLAMSSGGGRRGHSHRTRVAHRSSRKKSYRAKKGVPSIKTGQKLVASDKEPA